MVLLDGLQQLVVCLCGRLQLITRILEQHANPFANYE
jgi:hypothetical protein